MDIATAKTVAQGAEKYFDGQKTPEITPGLRDDGHFLISSHFPDQKSVGKKGHSKGLSSVRE